MREPTKVKLRECVTLVKGKPPAQQPYHGSDAERYLTPEYLRGASSCDTVKPAPKAVRVKEGDTILLWDGSNAGEVLRGRDGILASTMSRACHNERFDRRYFFYALKRWEPYLKGQTSGSGIPHIDKEILGQLKIMEFDDHEQLKIADVLSTVDLAIEQTEGLIVKQQRIKTGLMQDLLTRGIDENGNLRSEATHKFKYSQVGRIPVEWDVVPLGSVTEFVTSGARGWAKYYREDGAIFLRIGNLTRDHIDLRMDDLAYVQPPPSAEGLRTKVQAGDLLISVTADLGIIGVVPDGFGEGYVNQHIALARLNPKEVSSRFVGWFLSGQQGRSQFDRLNESGAKAGLNLPTVRAILFAKPKHDEQQRIAALLDSSVRTSRRQMCSLRKLAHIKAGLMHNLLTGERRVTALLEKEVPS